MVDVTIRKRYRNSGTVYEYRFEIASVDGKRQWQTKSGFKTVAEARKAGRAALQSYENVGRVVEKIKYLLRIILTIGLIIIVPWT